MSLEGRPAEIGARYARDIITRSREIIARLMGRVKGGQRGRFIMILCTASADWREFIITNHDDSLVYRCAATTRRADAHRRADALARFTTERSTRPRAAHARAQQRASHATATTQNAPAAHARHAPNGVTPTNAPPERARAASTRGAELRYRA